MCFFKAECILYLGKRQEIEGDSEDKNPGSTGCTGLQWWLSLPRQ